KPVVLIDVYNDDVRNMKGLRDKILKQRVISIDRLRDAKNVGVLIEIKPGQKFGSPKKILQKLRDAGKNAILITMSEITPDKLMNFYSIDAFIELACPRIAIDDFAKYSKPILTLKEALVALGEKSWDDILENGII
ncbi:MAG: 2-(3-amino-3-carboxypropyl)histidine synthase subunit, partial [Nanoarchaeota archaeon]|nr:2-(3-amino-3-carboxypropyl)histidine synthase subunit [Nanoarchaeota archaeon]